MLGVWLADFYLVVSPGWVEDSVATIVMPFLLALAVGLHITIFLGLRADGGHFEIDREWLARVSGMKLKVGFFWLLLAFCAIGLPRLMLGNAEDVQAVMSYLFPATLTTPVVAWLGQHAATRARGIVAARLEKSSALSAAALGNIALVVIALLVALMSVAMQKLPLGLLGGPLTEWIKTRADCLPCDGGVVIFIAEMLPSVLASLIFFALFKFCGRRINANRFSLHAVYRNRLGRAFLGSPREDRKRTAHPFANFDARDDRPLVDVWKQCEPPRLFPVVNMTLNLAATRKPEWLERKAMSFAASPLHCGAAQLAGQGAFIQTEDYAGKESPTDHQDRGMTLATAIAISGAAASPNWGIIRPPRWRF